MFRLLLAIFFIATNSVALHIINFEFETYTTNLYFQPDLDVHWQGRVFNKSEQFGACEGRYSFDLEQKRLLLRFESEHNDKACTAQNMTIVLDYLSYIELINGRTCRAFYEQEIPPYDPAQVLMRLIVQSY